MKVSFGMYWESYGRQEYEVPDGLNTDEIIKYLKEHWDEIPVPEGDYIASSDELDEESVVIENDIRQKSCIRHKNFGLFKHTCAVCGKAIALNPIEVRYTTFRLCDECIKAIKFARRLMNANPRADKMLPCLEDDIK